MGRLLVALSMLALLSGCGSSAASPLTLSCRLQRLPSGAVRAAVTVSNSGSRPLAAIVYGPALTWVQHIYPVLRPAQVIVTVHQASQSFIGFAVPRVAPQQPAHLLLRFAPPPSPSALLVSDKSSVHAASWRVLHNSRCTVRRLP